MSNLKHTEFIDPRKNACFLDFFQNEFNICIEEFIEKIINCIDPDFGINYEIDSPFAKFYSSVHATVFFNLFLCNFLSEEGIRFFQDSLIILRDKNPNKRYEKEPSDVFAWDVIEGPNLFSTAISCYALIISNFSNLDYIKESIFWITENKNKEELWPVIQNSENNYFSTFYCYLALNSWRKNHSDDHACITRIESCFSEISIYINNIIKSIFDSSLEHNFNISISDFIILMFLSKNLSPQLFSEYNFKMKQFLETNLINNDFWYESTLSNYSGIGWRKEKVSYNPAFVPILLNLGWGTTDDVVLLFLSQIINDMRSNWNNYPRTIPWRSSDSLIQTFIVSLSIFSLYRWYESFLMESVKPIKDILSEGITLQRDVFICYASENKEEYILPLVKSLRENNISTWYDQGEIHWGDQIVSKIQNGMRKSKFAIICVSKDFVNKSFPSMELESLFMKQLDEQRKIILPLILNGEKEFFENYPMLKGISFIRWTEGINKIISSLKKLLL